MAITSDYLIEVYRPQMEKKLPDAQKGREVASIGDLLSDGGALTPPTGAGAATVIGYNFGGEYSAVPYSQEVMGFNLVMRDIEGQIPGPAPTQDAHLANKSYVDEAVANAPTATWDTLGGKPAVIAAGSDQAAARTAIGAGTSNLTIGTTAATAMAGNKEPTTSERGGVLQQAAMADLTAAPTQDNFNAVLAVLRDAGVIATS
ncbi:hypothetical protein [Phyllobacterium leguminum]|uniref:Head fiber protein n=1 Tax=Phyllobacterium leguminum TaxID=314237 RepID=A0A318T9N7_9HYPH|nr:hypothetical protein [Phyllobacterium leguminum]PYE89599.1 hypothetical protein C7477_103107 [Phyllobacterium leguminum]